MVQCSTLPQIRIHVRDVRVRGAIGVCVDVRIDMAVRVVLVVLVRSVRMVRVRHVGVWQRRIGVWEVSMIGVIGMGGPGLCAKAEGMFTTVTSGATHPAGRSARRVKSFCRSATVASNTRMSVDHRPHLSTCGTRRHAPDRAQGTHRDGSLPDPCFIGTGWS
jgi:hypothetical protein